MNAEEKFEIQGEVQEEGKFKKMKEFFGNVGRRNIIIVCAVLLVAAAVCLNWIMFAGDSKDGYDYDKGAETGNNLDSSEASESAAYFSSTQVSRDRARDEALEVLQTVVNSAETDSTTKTQALNDISVIAKNIESEANIESMVLAKGFEQCIAIINDGNCTIVVKTDGLKQNQISQINEIVYEQAGIKPVNIKYIEKK